MTVLAPEFLQTTKYSAQRMRAMMAASGPIQEGIVNFGDFQVKQRGAGANMSVDVTAGDAWVQGDNTARQGWYHVGNDATVNVAVPAAHATLPRIDQVVLRIYDSTVIGGEKDLATIEVVSGTATAGATLANLTGAAALPASAIRLGYVLVGAAVVKIETANLGNLKDHRAGLTGYPASASPLAVAGAPPMYAMGRPAAYLPSVRVTKEAAQAYGPLFWDKEAWDTEAMHDNVTNKDRLLCVTPGFYRTWLQIQGTNQTWVETQTTRNLVGGGTETLADFLTPSSGQPTRMNSTAMTRLCFGDYVTFGYASASGSGAPPEGGMAGMEWVGP